MSSHHHTDDHHIDDTDPADAALLDVLGQALRTVDPVPAHVLAAAQGAVAWRTIDQDLADLVFDSAFELTGVRDPDAARQLTFRSGDVEIELMVIDSATRRLVGQIVPARAATVTLDGTESQVAETSDRFGRFSFDHVQKGPVRLTVAGPSGDRGIATDWVLL